MISSFIDLKCYLADCNQEYEKCFYLFLNQKTQYAK